MPSHTPRRPLIGITTDNRDNSAASGKYESARAYSAAVAAAGGLPVMLAQDPELAREYVARCDGLVLTGGCDIRMDMFGEETHPAAKCMDPGRQDFELALLAAAAEREELPVLGVCLGMQLMSVHSGGRMHQHLPEVVGEQAAAGHTQDRRHGVVLECGDSLLHELSQQAGDEDEADQARDAEPSVVSYHHQAVSDPGALRIVATAQDGVIEAVDDPRRPFYLGVQWHPERGGPGAFNRGLFAAFIRACLAGLGK